MNVIQDAASVRQTGEQSGFPAARATRGKTLLACDGTGLFSELIGLQKLAPEGPSEEVVTAGLGSRGEAGEEGDRRSRPSVTGQFRHSQEPAGLSGCSGTSCEARMSEMISCLNRILHLFVCG